MRAKRHVYGSDARRTRKCDGAGGTWKRLVKRINDMWMFSHNRHTQHFGCPMISLDTSFDDTDFQHHLRTDFRTTPSSTHSSQCEASIPVPQ